ncbi:MAG TPA: RagB/SusD family nutrient uptake outer membrane protein, partial [Bacteroidales bacterium]|nr:RagB/SusD family nutrient uptake outer membrane protein [Bacteroidales bacterium]
MNKIFKILATRVLGLLIILVCIVGCEESFLDTKPATSVSEKDIYTDVETAKGVISGMYAQFKSWGVRYSSASMSGLHSAAMVRDCMGPDVLIVKSWYRAEATYGAFNPSNSRVAYLWSELYFVINNINNVLSQIDNLTGSDEAKNQLRGEALAIRGWAYFELIRTHQHTYTIASSQPGIPVYTEPATGDSKGNPRGTVDQVYQQILSDLTTALPIIGSSRSTKFYFNDDVVEAVLAQVYLTMGNWSQAIAYASSVKADYPLMSASEWQSGFNGFNSEWIWGQNNTSDENPDWGSAHNMMDPINGGSEAGWRVSDALTSLYSATDVRGAMIVDDGLGYNANTKWQDIPSPLFSADYPLIRSAEMYLIEAEARAKSNPPDFAGAQTALYAVQFRADPNAVISSASGQALIDEIIEEKRKEFWGEGIYLRDMLRNQMPLVRDATHNYIYNLPANS